MTTTNPNDLEQLSAMQSGKDAAMKLMSSASPELRQQGAALLSKFNDDLNAYTVSQEEQRIAAETLDAQLQRDLDKETYDKHRSLLGDFTAESANFEKQIATADNITQALNRGDGAAITAALATLPLLVNPQAGATTEAEVEIWQKIGGRADALIASIQKELGAGGLSDPTRKEIIGLTSQYKRNAIAFQQARESYYGQLVVDEKIPENLWRQYNISGRLPVVQQGGFIRGETHIINEGGSATERAKGFLETAKGFTTEAIDNTSMFINDKVDGYKHEKAWRNEFFKLHGREPRADEGG